MKTSDMFDRLFEVKATLETIYYEERASLKIEFAQLIVDAHSKIGLALDYMARPRNPYDLAQPKRKKTRRHK
jgi:hypothetical protein